MKKNALFNKIDKDVLKKDLAQEPFERITASFYVYHPIDDPQLFRDELFMAWNKLNIFGRIYVATEGINAQLSVPEHHWNQFLETMNSFPILKNILVSSNLPDFSHMIYIE